MVLEVFIFALALALSSGDSSYSKSDLIQWKLQEKMLVSHVLNGYDKTIRPPGQNNLSDPVTVSFTMYIKGLGLDEDQQEMSVRGYVRQIWNDPRLRVQQDCLPCGYKVIYRSDDMFVNRKIWIPDTYLLQNSQGFVRSSDLGTGRSFLRFNANGDILSSMLINAKISCPMGYHKKTTGSVVSCEITFESYGYSFEDVVYQWKTGHSAAVSIDPSLIVVGKGWNLKNHTYSSVETILATGKYTSVKLNLSFVKEEIPVAMPEEEL